MKKKTKKDKTATKRAPKKKKKGHSDLGRLCLYTRLYFTTKWPKLLLYTALISTGLTIGILLDNKIFTKRQEVLAEKTENKYWLILHRKSSVELLYKGVLGNEKSSELIRSFHVKTGIPNERPTPLPQLFGRKYWVITKKYEVENNTETGPHFLEFDVPHPEVEPYGPVPYLECNGQCNWEVPGPFGLHGINGDLSRLSQENYGSSGCVRHLDSDLEYLYNLLDPEKEEIRYYIKDI